MDQTALAELATARDFIRWGATRMLAADLCFGHGTDNAVDEAAYLTAFALHFSPALPDALLDGRLTTPEKRAVASLFERRVAERMPAAYLTGEAWFAGLRFRVDPRVLVPRSPFAELVAGGFEPWLVEPPRRVLDLCTGSGCIGIACAMHLGCVVDAVDISPDALAVAAANVADHGLEEQVRLVESDLFDALAGERYDLIVSNPPYVGDEEWADLASEYRREPALGLRSGVDGLDAPLRILAAAPDFLNDAGALFLEVGASAPALAAALPDDAGLTWVAFERGGDGVCFIDRATLLGLRSAIDSLLEARRGHVV